MHLTIGASLVCQNCITSPSYYTQCIVLHSMHHIIKNAFINAAVLCWRYKLHHRGCITSSTLYYIFNAALNHTRCIISSRQYYIINTTLRLQRWTISSTLHDIVNAALKSGLDALLHMRILSNSLTPHYLVHYQNSRDVKFRIKFYIDLSLVSWGC